MDNEKLGRKKKILINKMCIEQGVDNKDQKDILIVVLNQTLENIFLNSEDIQNMIDMSLGKKQQKK